MYFHRPLLFLLSLLVLACQSNKTETISVEDIDFMTNDATEIFFKNVRQSSYDKQEIAVAGMDVFRMTDRNMQADYPLVHFAIAYNWRNDQAFLMVEPNEYVTTPDEFEIICVNPALQDTAIISYTMGNMQDQVTFAHHLFQAINAEDQLFLNQVDRAPTPIFDNFEDREVLRKTMLDYYKLIGLMP
jgi:hypothetical protein